MDNFFGKLGSFKWIKIENNEATYTKTMISGDAAELAVGTKSIDMRKCKKHVWELKFQTEQFGPSAKTEENERQEASMTVIITDKFDAKTTKTQCTKTFVSTNSPYYLAWVGNSGYLYCCRKYGDSQQSSVVEYTSKVPFYYGDSVTVELQPDTENKNMIRVLLKRGDVVVKEHQSKLRYNEKGVDELTLLPNDREYRIVIEMNTPRTKTVIVSSVSQ